jgi:L-fuconolactonase
VRVDAHHHVRDLTVRDLPWIHGSPVLHLTYTADDLRPALLRNAIDATVVVQTCAVAEETAELLALAAGDPHTRAVVGCADLADPALADRLAALCEGPGGPALVGLRHPVTDEADPDWLSRAEVRHGLRAAADTGLVHDLLVRPDQLPAAVRAVRELPEVRFVLDHAGNPVIDPDAFTGWAGHMAALAACPNVAVKLSGLVTCAGGDPVRALRPFTGVLLSALGPQRLMYGSDWPVCLLTAGYEEVLTLAETLTEGLGTEEREAVFNATAAHWYGIRA